MSGFGFHCKIWELLFCRKPNTFQLTETKLQPLGLKVVLVILDFLPNKTNQVVILMSISCKLQTVKSHLLNMFKKIAAN